jgi:hypothetical protein
VYPDVQEALGAALKKADRTNESITIRIALYENMTEALTGSKSLVFNYESKEQEVAAVRVVLPQISLNLAWDLVMSKRRLLHHGPVYDRVLRSAYESRARPTDSALLLQTIEAMAADVRGDLRDASRRYTKLLASRDVRATGFSRDATERSSGLEIMTLVCMHHRLSASPSVPPSPGHGKPL